MATKQNNVQKVNGGLSLDFTPFSQPTGTYRYALNAVVENKDGLWGTLSSEEGNIQCANLPTGYYPIGEVQMIDGESVVFSVNPALEIGEIGIMHNDCTYTSLVNESCLNFSKGIDAVYRILKGCDRLIYFVDGVNPDRVINIDDILRNPTDHNYLTNGSFDCDKLKQKLNFFPACVTDVVIENGGGDLEHGVYHFVLQYEDANGNTTDYYFDSHPIPIINGNYGVNYTDLTGGDPDLFGPTNKSIRFSLTNVDTNFKYVNIIAGHTKGGITTFNMVDQLVITDSTMSYTFSSMLTDDATSVQLDEIVSFKNPYDKSKHIEIHDNRLIKAYTYEDEVLFHKFQQAANDVCVRYISKQIPDEDSSSDSGSVKTGKHYTKTRSLMRDEVYSLSLVWVLDNGQEIVTHIPGRKKDQKCGGGSFPSQDDFLNSNHNRPQPTSGGEGQTGWDSAYIEAERGGARHPDFEHIPTDELIDEAVPTANKVKYVERWKAYNTAFRETLGLANGVGDDLRGQMSYFESRYFYPMTKDCEGNYVFPVEGGQPTPIRHHKTPDTTLEPHMQYSTSEEEYYKMPLGLEVSNVIVPTEYANRVIGYYVAKEKRDSVNKTVLDKGIFFINAYVQLVFGCNHDDIREYQFQTNSFNRSTFRDDIQIRGASDRKAQLENGLHPMYVDIIWGGDVFESYGYRNEPGGTADAKYARDWINYDDTQQSYHAPKHKFYGETYGGDHVKIEEVMFDYMENLGDRETGNNDDKEAFDTRFTWAKYERYSVPDTGMTNRTLKSQPVNIDANGEVPSTVIDRHFWNQTQQETLLMQFQTGLDNLTDYDDKCASCPDDDVPLWETGDGVTEADEHDGLTRALYGSIKSYSRNIYGQIDSTLYFKMSECMHDINDSIVDVFGGDVFITKFSFFKSMMSFVKTKGGTATQNEYVNENSPGAGINECQTDKKNNEPFVTTLDKNLITFFVESEINTELRNIDPSSAEADNAFFPLTSDPEEFIKLGYVTNAGDEDPDCPDGTGGFAPYKCDLYPKNLYLYNADYSFERIAKPHVSLPLDFDYCKDCAVEFPYRIIYSEQSYLEDRVDRFLDFRANNYRDLPAIHGEITDLFVNFDEMYAHTQNTLYKIFTRPYQMNSDQTTLYVGTGEFFAVPPREFTSTDYNYDGSSNKWATKSTEYGTFFVGNSGKMFLLTDKVKEIGEGNTNWFEENIPYEDTSIRNYFTDTEYDTVYNADVFSPLGTGFVSTYDPRHKRILVTKIDANRLNDEPFAGIDFNDPNFDNAEYFEQKSWTMSFSFKNQKWISYHSYLPHFYQNDGEKFYSYNVNQRWRHNEFNFQNYYDEDFDFIVDFVNNFNPQATKTFNAIAYVGSVEEWDDTNKAWVDQRDETFTDLIAYTHRQSTGKVPLTVKNTTPFASVTGVGPLVGKTEGVWRINNFRDYVTDRTANPTTKDWAKLQNDFPIDTVPNTDVIDPNKAAFELEDIRNQYLNIRLFFSSDDDKRIVLELFDTLNNFSIR